MILPVGVMVVALGARLVGNTRINEEVATMEKEEADMISPGTLVQLNPDTVVNKMFACCFMTVTEVRSWGAQGYVQALGENGNPGGQAHYRATWPEMEPVGFAEWLAD